MCLMSCGNVSSLSLPRSNEKEAAAANRLRSARFWQESSTNAGQDANGPCFPPAMDQKALSTSTSSDGTKPASWRRFFASFLLNMGKRSASTPNGRLWTAPCCKPRRALKKSATEGLGRNPTDRGRSGGKIHLHVDGQGIPLGVTVTGANVHDSRLIEATLKNSREMGGWFLGSAVRHLCLDKGYDYPRVRACLETSAFIVTRRHVDKKRLCAAAKTREDCQTVPQRSDGQRMGACTSSPAPCFWRRSEAQNRPA